MVGILVAMASPLAAEPHEIVTIELTSGERVVGWIAEEGPTTMVVESALLGRVTLSRKGAKVIRGTAAPTVSAPATEKVPASAEATDPYVAALFGSFLAALTKPAVQPAWTDWFRGWHGLVSLGWEAERRAEKRSRVVGYAEILKTVGKTQVRVNGLYISQSKNGAKEIELTSLGLRFQQQLGTSWELKSVNSWTRSPTTVLVGPLLPGLPPTVGGLEQGLAAGSINYIFWQRPGAKVTAGPGIVWTETKFGGLLPLQLRSTGIGGQLGAQWAPARWIVFESEASTAEFRNVVFGLDLKLASVKSRAVMLLRRPWTISLRHEYNRVELAGQVGLPPLIPAFRIPVYNESILWLDFGYKF